MSGRFSPTRFASALATLLLCVSAARAQPQQKCRTVEHAVPGGAKLLTVFCPAGTSEMPVLSVLADTLGGDGVRAGGLGKVWVLSYTSPTLFGRFEALFPIFFPGRRQSAGSPAGMPAPVADLSRPSHQTWRRLAGLITQAEFLDVRGALVRAPTRSYRGNASSYKQMKISEGLAAIEEAGVASGAESSGLLSTEQWRELDSRLALSARLLGGFISNQRLDAAWAKRRREEQERRGHNWELLRQRVEANGLYFQPLDFGALAPAEAIVWVARPDLANGASHPFDRAFLGIDNPFTDDALKHWAGYEETWYLDVQGRRCEPGAPGAKAVKMIPLAVYSLSYPRAPLLLVDFRSAVRTQSREVAGRVTDYVTLGVFGLTGFANWEYMAAHAVWQWYRERHGAATDQAERMRAYAELRLALLMGSGLDPKLGDLIARCVDATPLSPFGEPVTREAALASSQYHALVRAADCPASPQSACGASLEEQIARDRGREMVPLVHRRPARVAFGAAAILSAGLYRHRETAQPALLASLDNDRRTRYLISALNRIVRSGPEIGPAWDPSIVNGYLDELARLNGSGGRHARRVSQVVAEVFAKSSDEETRLRCLACLARLRSPASLRTLTRLMERGDVPASLRAAAAVLQAGNQPPVQPVPSAEMPAAASFRGR